MARILARCATVLLLVSPALAADFADCLPEDAMVYVETDSPRAITERLAGLDLLDRERRSAEDLRERLGAQLARWTGSNWARWFLSLRTVRRVRFAFLEGGGGRRDRYLLSFDLAEAAPLVALSAKRFGDGLETVVHRGRTCLVFSDSRSQPVQGAFLDDQFVVGVGPGALADVVDALLDGLPRSLGRNEAFRRVAREHGGRPLWGWVRLDLGDAGLGERFDGVARLGDLTAIGFGDDVSGDRARVSLYHAPGQPIVRLIQTNPPGADLLRWLPADSRYALATEIPDVAGRWRSILDVLVRGEEAGFGTGVVRERVDAMEAALGLEVDDALRASDGRCALLLSARTPAETMVPNLAVVLGVADRERVAALVERSIERGGLFRDVDPAAIRLESYRGFSVGTVEGRFGWALDERYLLFCGNADDVRPLIDRHAGAGATRGVDDAGMVHVLSPCVLLESMEACEAARAVAPGRPIRIAMRQREDRLELDLDVPLAGLIALALEEPERFFDPRAWRTRLVDLLRWMGLS